MDWYAPSVLWQAEFSYISSQIVLESVAQPLMKPMIFPSDSATKKHSGNAAIRALKDSPVAASAAGKQIASTSVTAARSDGRTGRIVYVIDVFLLFDTT